MSHKPDQSRKGHTKTWLGIEPARVVLLYDMIAYQRLKNRHSTFLEQISAIPGLQLYHFCMQLLQFISIILLSLPFTFFQYISASLGVYRLKNSYNSFLYFSHLLRFYILHFLQTFLKFQKFKHFYCSVSVRFNISNFKLLQFMLHC